MEEAEVARMPLLQTKDSVFPSLKESGNSISFNAFFVRKMIDLQACFPKCKKVTLPCDGWYNGKVVPPRCFKNWRDAKPGILGQEERRYAWRRCWTPGNIVLSQHLKVGARECRF